MEVRADNTGGQGGTEELPPPEPEESGTPGYTQVATVQPVFNTAPLTVYALPLTQQQLDEMASDAWHMNVNASGGIVIKTGGTSKVLKIESKEGLGTFLRIYSEGKCIFEEKLLDEEATWESFFTSESNDEGESIIMEKDPNNLPLGSSVDFDEIDSFKLKKKYGEVIIVGNPLTLTKINDEIQKINDELQELRDDLAKWETYYSGQNTGNLGIYLREKYGVVSVANEVIETKIESLEDRLAKLNNLNIN